MFTVTPVGLSKPTWGYRHLALTDRPVHFSNLDDSRRVIRQRIRRLSSSAYALAGHI